MMATSARTLRARLERLSRRAQRSANVSFRQKAMKKLCAASGHQQKIGDFSNRTVVVVEGKSVVICGVCGEQVKT